jgi:hypothetical protein
MPQTMTERQINSVRTKIDKIKKALAADKRQWGGQYHDGRGLRYLPPQHYLKLQDYSGALKYFNWFHKNFPDDSGYPDFLFEWTIALFYCGKLADAEKKAFSTYFGNAYYFDKYFNKPITRIDKWHGSNWQTIEMTDEFIYSSSQTNLTEFSIWLSQFINTDNFKQTIKAHNDIELQLIDEPTGPKRTELVRRLYLIKNNA